nr:hypothetical protein Iba_chr05fCG15440 [Ipomoea batatas]GME13302.1 hypothetical protein Iba_scaffold14379.3CG0130 [Ipomoea batatas]
MENNGVHRAGWVLVMIIDEVEKRGMREKGFTVKQGFLLEKTKESRSKLKCAWPSRMVDPKNSTCAVYMLTQRSKAKRTISAWQYDHAGA